MSTCKYFQVPVDPQVLENPRVFHSWLRVTRWLKPARIQVLHFEFEIPYGSGSPASALVLTLNHEPAQRNLLEHEPAVSNLTDI